MKLFSLVKHQLSANLSGYRSKLGAAIICASTLVVGACSSLPTGYERIPSYAIEDTSSTSLGERLQPLLNDHPGESGFYMLEKGEAAFAARIRLIKIAEKSIDAQYYIWHDDLTGRSMHNQLLDAADRGVRVRLLLDDLDTAGKDTVLRVIDAHPNVEVRLFNPFANRQHRIQDFVGDTGRINHRMHNKTITSDSLATIFGGRNIGDEYFAASEELGFGDMDALAVGPIAAEISTQFDLYWNSEWAFPITAFEWDSPVTEEAVEKFRTESDGYRENTISSPYADVIRQYDTGTVSNVADMDLVWSDWLLSYDQPSKVTAKKVSAETHLAPHLKQAMDQTERDLIIVSPYFVPGTKFTDYLVSLVERGVRVRILTNSLQANDVAMVHAGYMRYRKDLVAGGVELYEFRADANKVARSKEHTYIHAAKASLHAKFFGFDQTHLFIGSFNLDGRSTKLNSELGAYFASPEQAKNLSEQFDTTAIQLGYRVTLNEQGGLEWVTIENGEETRLFKEPDTTWWKRFSTGVLSIFVPEAML